MWSVRRLALEYDMFIDGQWVHSVSEETMEVRCPADQSLVATVAKANSDDVDVAVQAARKAFDKDEWSSYLYAPIRADYLRKIATILHEEVDRLAELESLSSGKPIMETSMIDIHLAADCFSYYADLASHIGGRQVPLAQQVLDFTLREPIGVIGMIVPFNFPLLLASFKVAPAFAAGNTVVLKPSEYTPLTVLELAHICNRIGIPDGVFNVVTGFGKDAGEALVQHTGVDKVSFTGSTGTGQRIMELCAKTLKKVTLELGGKGPNIVFADCNLDQAVSGVMTGAFMNQGEVCIAGTRVYVERPIWAQFLSQFLTRVKKLKVGHPLSWDTNMGSLISQQQLDKVEYFVSRGIAQGGHLLCGGKRPTEPELAAGFFYEPTVFIDVPADAEVCQEEIFGPVIVILPFSGEAEAVALANQSKYGLAGGVWTQDIKKGLRMARRLQLGTVWINNYSMLRVEAPFGGYKQSGMGRELGIEGLLDYTQVKNVYVELEEEILYLYD